MADEENISHEKESETKETTQVERPEYVPEKFWDIDNSSVNVESMASSYNALEKKLGSRTEDLSKSIREDIPNERKENVPENYEIKPPTDLPEDVEFQVNDGQPILEWWKTFAKERGLNQNEFDKGIDAFVKNELSNTPNPNEEMRKLGDSSKERVESANIWAKKYLSQEAYDTLKGISSTADGVKAIGLSGADMSMIPATKRPVKPVDFGYVGDIDPSDINVTDLLKLLSSGTTPVFAALTQDKITGGLLNTNADTIAQALAVALSDSAKVHLIYAFEKAGVQRDINDVDSVIHIINSI